MTRLAGKRVLLTGTAGGQGEAAQAMFAREGARIVGCDVQEGSAERTAQALRADGHDVTGHTVDLADPEAAAEWVNEAVDSLGGVDVVYDNAAGAGFAPFAEMTLELWRHVMRVELDIVFHVTQPAWRHLLAAGGGSIISTASCQMDMHLIRRPGTGDDIAHLAVFLASDESTWVTGQNYSVDGGVTAGFR